MRRSGQRATSADCPLTEAVGHAIMPTDMTTPFGYLDRHGHRHQNVPAPRTERSAPGSDRDTSRCFPASSAWPMKNDVKLAAGHPAGLTIMTSRQSGLSRVSKRSPERQVVASATFGNVSSERLTGSPPTFR